MKKLLQLAMLCAISCPAFAANYYVGPGGGTRFSANVGTGMCDGTVDVTYATATGQPAALFWQPNTAFTLGQVVYSPNGLKATVTTAGTTGSGINWTSGAVTSGSAVFTLGSSYPTNQHCKFSEAKMLYQDGSYSGGGTFPAWGWIGTGGDHYFIEGSIADGISYRFGFPQAGSCFSTEQINGTPANCWGLAGDSVDSGMLSPPAGSAGAHTQIYGGNFAACSANNARTQVHGGFGMGQVITMATSYVDVKCLDITDFSGCSPYQPSGSTCNSSTDSANTGIAFNTSSHDISLENVRAHGLAFAGFGGPTGGGITMDHFALVGNAHAGWDADGGGGITGFGTLSMTNFDISWNGCAEQYPLVDPLPYDHCADQSHGGYGDGFGTATATSPSPGWQVYIANGTVSFNTQDGIDALHIFGSGSTLTVLNTLTYSNMGQQIKAGGSPTKVINNVIVGNSMAMCSPVVIPGTPAGYNTFLSDCGRPAAENLPLVVNVIPGTSTDVQFNTIYAYGTIGTEVEYGTGDHGATNVMKYDDNIFVGFFYPVTGENPTPIFGNNGLGMLTNPGSSWSHNSYFGYRTNWTCPNGSETGALCVSPALVTTTMPDYGYANFAPATTGSSVYHAGVALAGITTDYNGTTRNNPPTIGACETTATCPGTVVPIAATPVSTPADGYSGVATTLTYTCSTPSSSIYYTTGGGTPSTLYTGGISVTVTSTYRAQCRASGYSDSAISSTTLTIGTPTAAAPTFAPGTGYSGPATTVTMSSVTSGATLCYTSDGSTPTANGSGTCTHGTTYSTAVSVASSLTLRAVASKSGFLDSSASSAAYTITPPVVPTGSVTGTGTITGTVNIP